MLACAKSSGALRLLCVLGVLSVLPVPLASAQDDGTEQPAVEGDEAERRAEDEAEAERQALVLFQRAVEHFESGEFERSALMLEEAIALRDVAVLHHNLGRALQEMGRWSEARAEYVLYLERDPETEQRSRVEARIAQIDARIAERAEPASQEPSLPPPARVAPREPSPAPWVVLGVGVLALGAAIPLGVLFDDAVGRARDAADHRAASGPAAEAETYAITADALLIGGGALALAGLIWGLIDLSAGDADGDADVEVSLGPAGVAVRGAF